MPEHDTRHEDQRLRQVAHDVQHCLYVIGLGTELLATVREDEHRFAELCEAIDKERRAAKELVGELLDIAFARR